MSPSRISWRASRRVVFEDVDVSAAAFDERGVSSVQERPVDGVFFLFTLGAELVIVGDRDKKVIISPWPTAD